MKLNSYQKIALSFMGFLAIFWVILALSGEKTSFWNYLYSFAFGLTPLFGGLLGLFKSKIWGRFRSALGKSVFFFSLGLFLWGAGEMIWSYYNFFVGEPAPYPSVADIGFGPSIFFWVVGAIYLSKATGAKFGWRRRGTKALALILMATVAAGSYNLLVNVARGGVITSGEGGYLKVALDILYPLGDLFAAVVAVLILGLSLRYFGGQYRSSIIIALAGLIIMFVADVIFSYTTTTGTFYNGSPGDLVLTLGTFAITFGMLGLMSKPRNLEKRGG